MKRFTMRYRNILITGASSGLGAALAHEYAAPGRVLGLIARRAELLEGVAADCRRKGAEVVTGALDVTDHARLAMWVQSLNATYPVDLVVANAGIFSGHGPAGTAETLETARRQVETNVLATMATIDPLLAHMRARRAGRIAIISSLAALHPLADAPAYSASKAAIASYGAALREFLAPDDVQVTLVYPGHIATDQVSRHIGRLPMLMAPEDAAAIIRRGIDRERDVIAFPMRLYWLVRLAQLLPWRLRTMLNQPLRFYVGSPSDG